MNKSSKPWDRINKEVLSDNQILLYWEKKVLKISLILSSLSHPENQLRQVLVYGVRTSTLSGLKAWNLNFCVGDDRLICEFIDDSPCSLICFILPEPEAFLFSGIISCPKEAKQLQVGIDPSAKNRKNADYEVAGRHPSGNLKENSKDVGLDIGSHLRWSIF